MAFYYWGLTPNSWYMDDGDVAGFSASPDWSLIEDDNLAELIEGATRFNHKDGGVQCSHPLMGYPNVYQSEVDYFAITEQDDLEKKEDDDDDLISNLTLD